MTTNLWVDASAVTSITNESSRHDESPTTPGTRSCADRIMPGVGGAETSRNGTGSAHGNAVENRVVHEVWTH